MESVLCTRRYFLIVELHYECLCVFGSHLCLHTQEGAVNISEDNRKINKFPCLSRDELSSSNGFEPVRYLAFVVTLTLAPQQSAVYLSASQVCCQSVRQFVHQLVSPSVSSVHFTCPQGTSQTNNNYKKEKLNGKKSCMRQADFSFIAA